MKRTDNNRAGRFAARFFSLLLTACLLTAEAAGASAAGYESYSYGYATGEAVAAPSPAPYLPERTVSLGALAGVKTAADFCRDAQGNWYVADSGAGQIVVLDADFGLVRVISAPEEAGALSAPTGVCVLSDGRLCVADTGNKRLVIFTPEGEFVTAYTLEGAQGLRSAFQPTRVGAGQEGQIYAVSKNDYTGLLELDREGNFLGYIGSTTVTYNWVDMLWKKLMTQTQNDKLVQFVPVEYNSLALDDDGFIFAVSASETESRPVRRLNPSGADVLSHNGYVEEIDGDAGFRSAFVDVCAGEDGLYHLLDSRKGRIFTYDADGYLLYVFGGLGAREGCTVEPVAIEGGGERLYLLDKASGCIEVYARTAYAGAIALGLRQYNTGHYAESMETWRGVLRENSNYDLAYAQIGKSLLRQKDYAQAMAYFKLGNFRGDRVVLDSGYNKAFTQYRRELLMQWWWAFLLGAVLVVSALAVGRRLWRKSRCPAVCAVRESRPAQQWRFSKHLLFHPFDGFWDMKREGRGSLIFALLLVGLWIVTNILSRQVTGFLFTETTVSTVDLPAEIRNVAVLFLLFTVGNWSITTLMGGEGTFRDIAMTFGYACLPLSLIGIPLSFVSNVLTYSEAGYVAIIQGAAWGWFFFLLFFGLLTVHQYSFGKTVATVLLTVAAMAVLTFVAMVFMELIVNMVGFVTALFQEIMLRV